MRKKIPSHEIDIFELITIIWTEKLKIILITFFTVILVFFFSNINSKTTKESFLSKTEILPNSTFYDYKFSAYNTFLNGSHSSFRLFVKETIEKQEPQISFSENPLQINLGGSLTAINSSKLYDLFIEKLNNREIIIKGVKKFNLINRENYENDSQYMKAVKQLASSIKIYSNSDKKNFIEFKIYNKKNWENFLSYIDENANIEIRDYLIKQFNLFLKNAKNFRKYEIEDINFEIKNNQNDKIIAQLEQIKRRKIQNQNLKRLEYLFINTPLMKSENFTAAKINIQSTIYIDQNTNEFMTMQKIVMVSIILGLFLGIIFVIILNNIKKR